MSMTIGEVIDALEAANPESSVHFAFGHTTPTTVGSWRGIYADAALGWQEDGGITVAELLKNLKESIDGEVFHGWKGGKYTYNRDTTLHIDNPGDCSNTEIYRIERFPSSVVIHTHREG